jgi:hypothetical protein
MLGDSPINPALLHEFEETRRFYHEQIGLEIWSEIEAAIVFRCGGGTHLTVTYSTTGTADTQTQAGWEVPDVRAEVAELRSRGVKVEEYDMPGLKTEDGIADIGFAWMAWIADPGKERARHSATQGRQLRSSRRCPRARGVPLGGAVSGRRSSASGAA